MPIQTDYLEQGRIVRYIFSDPWTIDEFIAMFEPAKDYLDGASEPVHWIVNLTTVVKDPVGVLRTRQHPAFSHARTGYVVFCVGNPLARRLVETALRLAHFNRTRFYRTEDDAMTFLRSQLRQNQILTS